MNEEDVTMSTWEPVPWRLAGPEAEAQRAGFLERAHWPLVWSVVDWKCFPGEGVFGQPRDWFVSNNIGYVTEHGDEHLVLIQNSWHGFPDPPEWGLATRHSQHTDQVWRWWGHFAVLPAAWRMPGDS